MDEGGWLFIINHFRKIDRVNRQVSQHSKPIQNLRVVFSRKVKIDKAEQNFLLYCCILFGNE